MKKLIIIFIAFQFLSFTNAFPQTDWVKHEGNPVLEPGPAGSWDSDGAMACSILYDGNIYHMWYSGFDGVFNQIGHATSSDGIDWTKDPNNPVVEVGQAGTWEESHAYIPNVLLIDNVYHMWYDGAWGWIEQTGHATSTDGSNWTKDPLNPVLEIGPTGSWDDYQVFPMAGSVIYEDNIFKMWYGGGSTSFVWQIGYATSPDGSVWTKDEANNPVITPGATGEWDDYGVIPGSVLRIGNTYNIWFSGCMSDNWWRVGHATSSDGIHWTKYELNPVLDYGAPGEWDVLQAWCPSVIYDDTGDMFKMWYSGGDYDSGKVGYATSENSQIIHVPADYPTIQAGIDAASSGNTVLVDEGIYYENINFKGKDITVASLFWDDGDTNHINNTIIDGGSPTNPDSASCVMFMHGEDTTSVLCGFTITNGSGLKYGSLQAYHGGGIVGFNSGAKIIHNIITGNSVASEGNALGGGISFITTSGNNWLVIRENSILNNSAEAVDQVALGGGVYSSINAILCDNSISNNTCISANSEGNGGGIGCHSLFTQEGILLMKNNKISNNYTLGSTTYGVGVFVMYYAVTMRDNFISNNYSDIDKYWGIGAVILEPSGKVYVLNNEFRENTGPIPASPGAGGGLSIRDAFDKYVIVDGNLFIDNVAKHGGGFYARNSYNMVLKNNLFMGDSAQLGGGIGLYHSQTDKHNGTKALSIPLIVNNTFFDNHVIETGGAIRLTGDAGVDLVTFNNIFYDNESLNGNDIFNNSLAELIWVYYSNIDEDNITGQWEGNNNFPGFPHFIDDSCHINCGAPSPCINAGIHEIEVGGIIYQAPAIDFDKEIRPQDGLFDIGADEQELCTFISDLNPSEKEIQLQINPNPTSGAVHLRYSIFDTRYSILEMYSVNGVLVRTLHEGSVQPGEHEQAFDVSDLPDGLYFVRLQVGEQVESQKIILLK